MRLRGGWPLISPHVFDRRIWPWTAGIGAEISAPTAGEGHPSHEGRLFVKSGNSEAIQISQSAGNREEAIDHNLGLSRCSPKGGEGVKPSCRGFRRGGRVKPNPNDGSSWPT